MRGTAQPGGNTVTNGEIFIPLPDSKDPIAFEKINLQQIALTLLFFCRTYVCWVQESLSSMRLR